MRAVGIQGAFGNLQSGVQSVENWIWKGGGVGQAIAAFSYKPFCIM